jgi:hypothetical protein
MTMSYRILGSFTVDPTTRLRRSTLFSARLIFWPLFALTLVALTLQLGAWKKEFKIAGPFAHGSCSARMFPSQVEAKPHCGLSRGQVRRLSHFMRSGF